MSQSPDHQSASVSTLYCAEDAGDVVSSVSDTRISHFNSPPFDENTISSLICSEPHHMPLPDYLQRCRDRSIDVTSRQDSINWILKVHAYYHFKPVTALLSVNYFDRFLSCHSLPQANGWPFQLLSVACLSLAAKMEEPEVPLLLDLQLFEPRFVFEPKTVQRMELRVMSILNWRLKSITPFDYLHYFISKLPSSCSNLDSFNRILSYSSDLILNTTRVVDFLGFASSTMAAAAVLCAAGESPGSPAIFHEIVNKEMVRSCHQLIEEYLIDMCPSAQLKDDHRAELQPAPPSPVGVLDAAACGSCDTRSENPSSTRQAEAEAEAEAEPSAKRPRSSAPDVQQP
ncbi:hypothetical protein LWI29_014420 [Acer saccharum]|uniref:B-like cyclin n=1 Tax=Acer saccharum TaxID=4024 RepID=A0AA39RUT3_ACESA|nr:hypothetical protein LWI29_014420 [Acer saccharum]KAK1559229.1 hypothetical protein Q3G72_012173 [Acer saccharum]